MMRAAARPTTKAVFGTTTAVVAVAAASARQKQRRRGRRGRLGEGREGGQRRRTSSSRSFWNGPDDDDVVGAIIGRRRIRRRRQRTTSVEATTTTAEEEEEEEEAETTTKTQPLLYDGHYGQWSVSRADEVEVWSYRIALSLSCCGALGVAAGCVFGKDGAIDPSYFVGASGLGVALVLVHMYVTPIKRAMQAMYAVGLVGSVGIAATQSGGESGGANVLEFVRDHPSAMWLVGPMFASFTGLAFKEGACYGKPEAFALFLLTPIMCLGHLTGLASGEARRFWSRVGCLFFAFSRAGNTRKR